MENNQSAILCKSCWNMGECSIEGVMEKQKCAEYKAMSPAELAERDAFVNSIFVGDCPFCGSSDTSCGLNPGSDDDDFTIGSCQDCGKFWCTECGYSFPGLKKDMECPHWKICEDCSAQNGYLDPIEFNEKFCSECEHEDEQDGCDLDDSTDCEKRTGTECPYDVDISDCTLIADFLKKQQKK